MDAQTSPTPRPDPPFELDPAPAWQRWLVSGFVLFHLAAIVVWNMPSSHLQIELKSRLSRYMTYVTLDQGWGMFAPEPGRENFYMQARITYASGEKRLWPIGRQDTLNPFERLINERERKMVENLYNPSAGQPYYNQIALWALRNNSSDRSNPPVRVELMRHWSPIPSLPDGVKMNPVTGWSSDVVYSLGLGKGIAR
ncbi:MAG: hypothetical protein KY468_14540 [Armatimonadetes bacterium]|nr:hypothetical protein [Armatimonadota bacterium]